MMHFCSRKYIQSAYLLIQKVDLGCCCLDHSRATHQEKEMSDGTQSRELDAR